MSKEDIHAWDSDDDSLALDVKMEEWAARAWAAWLKESLFFPFRAKREHDDADALFTDAADKEPFRQGQEMGVVGLEPDEDATVGFLVKVREGKHEGRVPLTSLEVAPRSDRNHWPVREYSVWFANRTL